MEEADTGGGTSCLGRVGPSPGYDFGIRWDECVPLPILQIPLQILRLPKDKKTSSMVDQGVEDRVLLLRSFLLAFFQFHQIRHDLQFHKILFK